MAAPLPSLPPRYEVLRLLGEGGMGRVYLARDRLDEGREVALKLYPARFYDARLRDEFLVLRDLHHPGVARAHHFGVLADSGAPYFTLDYVPGLPLDRFLAEPKSPEDGDAAVRGGMHHASALRLFTGVAAAVGYLHRRGILHLDLKPSNILVVRDAPGLPARPVLIDFGLVTLAASARTVGHGTLPYLAPELLAGATPLPQSDVYSLAATFYRVLTGRYPVEGGEPEAVRRLHRTSSVAFPRELPEALGHLLLRALAKEPEHRFADAVELHRALLQPELRVLEGSAGREPDLHFHEPDFVGRERELESLESWLDEDRRVAPLFEVLGGDGWGKTRFLEKATTAIEVRGHDVLPVRFSGSGGLDLLLACLADLRPEIRARAGPARTKASSTSSPAELRLLAAIEEGDFLVLDDLHLASPEDILRVERLDRAVERLGHPPRGGIVATRKGDRLPASTAESTHALARRVVLGPLRASEALKVDLDGLDGALSRFSAGRARALKLRLHEEVGGHPLFYVRGLVELARPGKETSVRSPVERIVERFEELPEDARRLAILLASLARPLSPADAAPLLGVAESEARSIVASLSRAGIASDGGTGTSVRILHVSVREAILERLSAEDRRACHLRLAKWLAGPSSLEAGASDVHSVARRSGESALHALEASESDLAFDQLDRWLAAGMPAADRLAEEGGALLERAATAAARRGDSRRVLYLESAGDFHEARGRLRSALAAFRALARESASPARGAEASARRVRLLRKLGGVQHSLGADQAALRTLSACVGPEAEKKAPHESLRARVALAEMHHFKGRADRAVEHARRGLELWRRRLRASTRGAHPAPGPSPLPAGGEVQGVVQLHAILGQVAIRRLRFGEAIRVLREGLALADSAGIGRARPVLLNNLALALHLDGELDQALALFSKAREAVGGDDPAVEVSIALNTAQILAKKGRFAAALEVIDALDVGPAVRESKRLRLGCLFTRGLILGLLGADADRVWKETLALADDVGDSFLSRLAAIHHAEGLTRTGRWTEAGRLFLGAASGNPLDRLAESMRLSRWALFCSFRGRGEEARQARREVQTSARGLPEQVLAWNELACGLSAMECGDEEDALRILGAARRRFRRMGILPGVLECELALGALQLSPTNERASPALARRSIRRAMALSLEAPAGRAVRLREARAALLEAACVVSELLPPTRGGQDRKPARGLGCDRATEIEATARRRIADLVARAAGDPSLGGDFAARRLALALGSVLATLSGDAEGARRAASRLAVLDPVGDTSDTWARWGLGGFRPFRARAKLGARHARGLEAILLAPRAAESPNEAAAQESPVPADLPRSLAAVGRATRALRVDLFHGGISVARWVSRAAPPARATRPIPVCVATLGSAERPLGILRVSLGDPRRFRTEDASFVACAARAIAVRLWVEPPECDRHVEGAASALTSPIAAEERVSASGDASNREDTLSVTRELPARRPRPEDLRRFLAELGFLSADPEMDRALATLPALAASELPILITGESGTGKNLLARAVHALSPRARGPFLSQSASAIPPELFEADLFGYRKGAFTGAEDSRTGFLFRAEGGSFHLEEVGDLTVPLEQILLRVIEGGRIRPLGASEERPIDVRFIASTHRDLDRLVESGEFRRDLFFRLSAARIHVPPLRSRPADLHLIAETTWRELAGPRSRLPRSAMEVLAAHPWPGNVRELLGVLRRLSLECEGAPDAMDVRSALGRAASVGSTSITREVFRSRSFEDVQRELEETYLLHLFESHGCDLARVASALGTTTRSVYRRFERLGLKPKDFLRSRGSSPEGRPPRARGERS